ncbi:colanic acid biosynthesis acetyltransferase WcaF [Sinimarinibacterium sp. CAU 1509]|uniref:putative colanic acid biosynthesis acetyltransferase n=1 Tax=Sinimarinibacterium sp. CAU 1509 TaxID=2562283 RepID=UPI0010AB68C2|nr:putative colanic acid biosynthesis acetyltransferase [Sinimarinibacterium sp. CAU 1509]TJY61958.1 colanic acid biosynthesis acetyltransferase WcaF [Sinimarinibacterium sp. CAU 1509]
MTDLEAVQKLNEFRLPPGFRGRSAVVVQLWWMVQGTLFGLSPQFMYGWRRWLLRLFGARVDAGAIIRPTVRITYPWKVIIGERAWIGDDVVLYSLGLITIGAHAVVSQRSYLCTGGHDYTRPTFDIYAEPIVIGPQAWLATDVFVAPGVVIGEETVVGARSSVFKSLPAGVVARGSPAKVVGARKRDDRVVSA